MQKIKIIEAIKIIDDFKKSPKNYISSINLDKKIPYFSVVKTEQYFFEQLLKLNDQQKLAIDDLSARLDRVNKQIVNKIQKNIQLKKDGLSLRLMPINRVGIYIPKQMPSSAYTFLSAANAAGVNNIVLFVAQDSSGDIDPLTIYIAKKYKSHIIGGPARIAFPTLAFGTEEVEKCDLICGPCGDNLNLLKNLCGLIGSVAVDMSSGASDLTIISDKEEYWEQIFYDLLSQLEHGKDSTSQLIIVGDNAKVSFDNCQYKYRLMETQVIDIVYVKESSYAIDIVCKKSPETLEVFSDDIEKYEKCYKSCGLVYFNTSSTLGDYGVIRRGCADPTGGCANGQSGISPFKFLKIVPVVTDINMTSKHIDAAISLAQYENLLAHKKALNNIKS